MSLSIIGRRPPRKRQKTNKDEGTGGLTKTSIVNAALDLIDREGLDNFSMRNIAKALGVYPTAIYWHVPSRNAVVAEIITVALQDLLPTEDLDWLDWFRTLFRNYRAAIRRHPNIAPLIGVQLVSNASLDFPMIEGILNRLTQAGFRDDRLAAAYNVVIAGMVSFTNLEYAMTPSEDAQQWRDTIKVGIAGLDREAYPLLARHIGRLENKAFILRWENGVEAPLDSGFDMFVETVILGLKAQL
jgi:TetR/AcrR family transcriptional regulator, tetracycline repressor protein